MIFYKPQSLFDEFYWNSDSFTRSGLYKISSSATSYGILSSSFDVDYYEITPGIGNFKLIVTSEGMNTSTFYSSSFDVKITDDIGNVLLSADSVGPDFYSDAVTFSSSSNQSYYVEVRNSGFSSLAYAAAIDTTEPVWSSPFTGLKASYTEGEKIQFSYTIAGTPGFSGTIFFFISGISQADTSTTLGGTASNLYIQKNIFFSTINGLGTASVEIALIDDGLAEGIEYLIISTRDGASSTVQILDPLDTTPPIVNSFSPTVNATGVATNSNIVLTFSEIIQRGTGSIQLREGSSSGTVVETFDVATSNRVGISNQSVTFDPQIVLLAGKSYFLTIPSGAFKDEAGNSYVGTQSYSFTTASVNSMPTGMVTITGTPTQGQTLTAANSLADADGLGAITYTWKANGANIGTGTAYTLTQAEVGKTITVTASYIDARGANESLSSSQTSSVENFDDPAIANIIITGSAEQGGSLIGSIENLSDPDGPKEIEWQWQLFENNEWSNITNTKSATLDISMDWKYVGRSTRLTAITRDQLGGSTQFISETKVISAIGTDFNIQVSTWHSDQPIRDLQIASADKQSTTDNLGLARFSKLIEREPNFNLEAPKDEAATNAAKKAVNLQDAVEILRLIAGSSRLAGDPESSKYTAYSADFDGSGTVNLADAIGVLRHAVGLSDSVPSWTYVKSSQIIAEKEKYLNPGVAPAISELASPPGPVSLSLKGILRGDVYSSYDIEYAKEAARSITYSRTSFSESDTNDGSIGQTSTVTLVGDVFLGAIGDQIDAATFTNLPNGLTGSLIKTSDTTAVLSLSGKAIAHKSSDSTENFGLSLEDSAFALGYASSISGSHRTDIGIDFTNPNRQMKYSLSSFLESELNDGSLSGTSQITLVGDAFNGEIGSQVPSIRFSNLPSGLTGSVVKTSVSTASLSFLGKAALHTSDDSVNNVILEFGDYAFELGSADSVTGSNKTDLTFQFQNPTRSIEFSRIAFSESDINDGSISQTSIISLNNDKFSGTDGAQILGAKLLNVPPGLVGKVIKINENTAALSFSGKALSHANINDFGSIELKFEDSSFYAGYAKLVIGSTRNDIAIDFTEISTPRKGDAKIAIGAYGNLTAPVQVDGGRWFYYWDTPLLTHAELDLLFAKTPEGVPNSVDANKDGKPDGTNSTFRYANINGILLALPTIGESGLVSQGYRANTSIGSNSTTGSNAINSKYDDLLAIWDAYNGIGTGSVKSAMGTPPGWSSGYYWSATPTSNGFAILNLSTGLVSDYSAPFDKWYTAVEMIGAAQTSKRISYSGLSTLENLSNTGAFSDSIYISLSGDEFIGVAGAAIYGVEFDNIPQGIVPAIIKISDTVAELKFSGAAQQHTSDHDVNNVSIKFNDTVFRGGSSLSVVGSTISSFKFDFRDYASQPLSRRGDETIDLGQHGKLIYPIKVDGDKWYYYWDRSGDGSTGGNDFVNHDVLDQIFSYDINGNANSSARNADGNYGTTDVFRYAVLNEVTVALPTLGSNPFPSGYRPGTSVDNNPPGEINATYDDYLAIWDAFNGTSTSSNTSGLPGSYNSTYYWTATPTDLGHAFFLFNGGYTGETYDAGQYLVILQVL